MKRIVSALVVTAVFCCKVEPAPAEPLPDRILAVHHGAARRWLSRMAPRPITYTDAVSFAVMEAAQCRQYLGFDGDFAAAGFTPLRRI